MVDVPTYGDAAKQPCHRSFFRSRLSGRARPVEKGKDAVHEYLIEQANLRGFRGAVTMRDDLGSIDPSVTLEDIVVGLIQPHAPAEIRVIKLVVRILQSGTIDPQRLVFHAKREKAVGVLHWIVDQVPEPERKGSIEILAALLARQPATRERRPEIDYDPARLIRKRLRP